MLGRVLSLVAALLLSCASTSAHAYAAHGCANVAGAGCAGATAQPLQAETARQGFAAAAHDAHREQARVTADPASENFPTSLEPSDGRRFYAKARYYGGGRGSFLSTDPWSGDETNPLSYNKYLYGYANPGMYIDPDGREAFTPDTERHYRMLHETDPSKVSALRAEEVRALQESTARVRATGNRAIGLGTALAEGVQASNEAARDVHLAKMGDSGAQLRVYDQIGAAVDVAVNPGRNYDEARIQQADQFELRAQLYREGRVDEAQQLEGRMAAPYVAALAPLARGTSPVRRVVGRPAVAAEAPNGGVRFNDIDREFRGDQIEHRVATPFAAPSGKTYITYVFKNAEGEIVYEGRASGSGTPEQVLSQRLSKGHHVFDETPGLTPEVQAVQGSRDANMGAEAVHYERLLRDGAPLLNDPRSPPLSSRPDKIEKTRARIQAYADDLAKD